MPQPLPKVHWKFFSFHFQPSFHHDLAERQAFGLGGFGQDAQKLDRGTLGEGAGQRIARFVPCSPVPAE